MLLVIAPHLAIAQIELDSNGNVSVGDGAVSATKKLYVKYNNGADATRVLHAEYSGGAFQASAIWGSAETTAEYGYGGTFYGGYKGIRAYADSDNSSGTRQGVYGYATGGDFNYGVYGHGKGGSGALNAIGVYGKAEGTGTKYGVYANGNVYTTGDYYKPSDQRLKEDIRSIDGGNVVGKLLQLNPVNYRFKPDEDFIFPEGEQFGLIAQEVEQIFPELVKSQLLIDITEPADGGSGVPVVREETYLSINYNGLIPVLLKAIQEQQAEIDALKSALNANGIQVNR